MASCGGGAGTANGEMDAVEALSALVLECESEHCASVEVHVEVALRRECAASAAAVEQAARQWAAQQAGGLEAGAVVTGSALGPLQAYASALVVCDVGHEPGAALPVAEDALTVHVHAAHTAAAARDALGAEDGDGEGGGGGGACEVWPLPHAELVGAWEALLVEGALKGDLVRLVASGLRLPGAGGRALLLHGPPGCGKTSLCRALAHKLAVRLAKRYPRARLIEVDAHSLFSRWFSESGKLVAKLFQQIFDLTEDPQTLTIVLVDEVESLAAARASAAAGLEPMDAVRAVNALLTGLDRLRRRDNALLLATSNVTRAVDSAFLDRADLCRLVGPPAAAAAYGILRALTKRLQATGALRATEPLWALRVLRDSAWAASTRTSLALLAVARRAASRGVSARALARLPLLALALHLSPAAPAPPPLPHYVVALHRALEQYLTDQQELQHAQGTTTTTAH